MCFQGKAGILTRPTDSRILISASYVSNPWERADRRLKGREDSVTTPVFLAWKMVTLFIQWSHCSWVLNPDSDAGAGSPSYRLRLCMAASLSMLIECAQRCDKCGMAALSDLPHPPSWGPAWSAFWTLHPSELPPEDDWSSLSEVCPLSPLSSVEGQEQT